MPVGRIPGGSGGGGQVPSSCTEQFVTYGCLSWSRVGGGRVVAEATGVAGVTIFRHGVQSTGAVLVRVGGGRDAVRVTGVAGVVIFLKIVEKNLLSDSLVGAAFVEAVVIFPQGLTKILLTPSLFDAASVEAILIFPPPLPEAKGSREAEAPDPGPLEAKGSQVCWH